MNGQPQLSVWDGEVPVDPTGMVTLTEKGSYYLLKLNKYPLEAKTAADKPEDAADIPTTGKYATAFTVGVFSFGSPCTGSIYLDDLKLLAKKTSTITFNKKDYVAKGLFAQHFLTYTPVPVTVGVIK